MTTGPHINRRHAVCVPLQRSFDSARCSLPQGKGESEHTWNENRQFFSGSGKSLDPTQLSAHCQTDQLEKQLTLLSTSLFRPDDDLAVRDACECLRSFRVQSPHASESDPGHLVNCW